MTHSTFVNRDHDLLPFTMKVIGTVSPAATDVYHTLNTLEQIVLMSPFLEAMTMQVRFIDGRPEPVMITYIFGLWI